MLEVCLTLISLLFFWPILFRVLSFVISFRDFLRIIKFYNGELAQEIKRQEIKITSIKAEARSLKKLLKNEQKKSETKTLLYLLSIATIVMVLFFYNTNEKLKLEDIDSWVNSAIFLNNFITPPILIFTLIVIYRTWMTSKTEFNKTQVQMAKQINIQQRVHKLDLLKNYVSSFNSTCQELIDKTCIHGAIVEFCIYLEKNNPVSFNIFSNYCMDNFGIVINEDKDIGRFHSIRDLSERLDFRINDILFFDSHVVVKSIMEDKISRYDQLGILNLKHIRVELAHFTLITMIKTNNNLLRNALSKIALIKELLENNDDLEFKSTLIDEFNSSINLDSFDMLLQIREQKYM